MPLNPHQFSSVLVRSIGGLEGISFCFELGSFVSKSRLVLVEVRDRRGTVLSLFCFWLSS